MAQIASRQGLKDYAMRRLGFPVIEINVDDDQVEDRVDDTFQYFFDYHYDGVERLYYAHELTQQDIDNQYVTVPDNLIHVTRVLPAGYANGLFYPMGDPSLAWNSTSANPLFGQGTGGAGGQSRTTQDAAGGDLRMDKSTFYLNMAAIEEFNQIIAGGEPTIRFSRHTDRVYIDSDIGEKLNAGLYLIIEGWASLDPEVYTQVYNDRWIKRYLTQMIKQQWGANLIKYSGIMLPGNVTFDGDKLFDQATQEIAKLEEEMQMQYELPVEFYMG